MKKIVQKIEDLLINITLAESGEYANSGARKRKKKRRKDKHIQKHSLKDILKPFIHKI